MRVVLSAAALMAATCAFGGGAAGGRGTLLFFFSDEAVVLPKPGRLDLRRDRIAISAADFAADFAAKYGIIHYVNRLRECRWTREDGSI